MSTDQQHEKLADEIVEAASILAAQNLSDQQLTEGISAIAKHAAQITGRAETQSFVAQAMRSAIESQRSVSGPAPTERQEQRAAREIEQQEKAAPARPSQQKAEKTAAKNLDKQEKEHLPGKDAAKEAQERAEQRLTTPREKKIGEDNPHLPSRQRRETGADRQTPPPVPEPNQPTSTTAAPPSPGDPQKPEQPGPHNAAAAVGPAEEVQRGYSDQQNQDYHDLKALMGSSVADKWLSQQTPEGPTLGSNDPGQVAPAIIEQPNDQSATAEPAPGGATVRPSASDPPPPIDNRTVGERTADRVQAVLDVVGIFDPTPIVDGANAVISLGRAGADKSRRREHLVNAGISAVAAGIPYAGDTAKLLKLGKGAKASRGARFGAAAARVHRASSRGQSQGESPGLLGSLSALVYGDESDATTATGQAASTGPAAVSRDREDRRVTEKFRGLLEATGALTLGFGALAAKAIKWTESLSDTNARKLNDAFRLSPFSGEIAIAEGRAQIRDAQRNIREGDRLAESTTRLSEAQSDLLDTQVRFTGELKRAGTNVSFVATSGLNAVASFVDELTKASKALQTFNDGTEWTAERAREVGEWIGERAGLNVPEKGPDAGKLPTDGFGVPWRDFMADLSDGKLDGKAPYYGSQDQYRIKDY